MNFLPCLDKRGIKNEICGDFAAVDFCEELCYHSLPKKQSEEEENNGKEKSRTRRCGVAEKIKRIKRAGEKARKTPKRFSGRFRALPRLFLFFAFKGSVLVCGEAQPSRTCIKTSTLESAEQLKMSYIKAPKIE